VDKSVVVGRHRPSHERVAAMSRRPAEASVNAARHPRCASVSLYAEWSPRISGYVRDRGSVFDLTEGRAGPAKWVLHGSHGSGSVGATRAGHTSVKSATVQHGGDTELGVTDGTACTHDRHRPGRSRTKWLSASRLRVFLVCTTLNAMLTRRGVGPSWRYVDGDVGEGQYGATAR